MTEENPSISLAVKRNDESSTALTSDELLDMGRKYARACRITISWREDAAQEFAIAGVNAISQASATDNMRAFQIKAGKWAVAKLWRSIHRNHKHEEDYQREMFGNFDSLTGLDPEALVDHTAPDPLTQLIDNEERTIMRRSIQLLPTLEREVLCAMVYEQKLLRELACEKQISVPHVGRIYRRAIQMLKKICTERPGEAHLRASPEGTQRFPQYRQRCDPSGSTSAPDFPQAGQGIPENRFDLSNAMNHLARQRTEGELYSPERF